MVREWALVRIMLLRISAELNFLVYYLSITLSSLFRESGESDVGKRLKKGIWRPRDILIANLRLVAHISKFDSVTMTRMILFHVLWFNQGLIH